MLNRIGVSPSLGLELHVKSFNAPVEVDLIDTFAVTAGASWGF